MVHSRSWKMSLAFAPWGSEPMFARYRRSVRSDQGLSPSPRSSPGPMLSKKSVSGFSNKPYPAPLVVGSSPPVRPEDPHRELTALRPRPVHADRAPAPLAAVSTVPTQRRRYRLASCAARVARARCIIDHAACICIHAACMRGGWRAGLSSRAVRPPSGDCHPVVLLMFTGGTTEYRIYRMQNAFV